MNFDLNIENYKKNELLDMFNLPSNYDQNILENCEKKLRDTIDRNQGITQETKMKTIHFIIQAKKILLEPIVQGKPINDGRTSISEFAAKLYNTS